MVLSLVMMVYSFQQWSWWKLDAVWRVLRTVMLWGERREWKALLKMKSELWGKMV